VMFSSVGSQARGPTVSTQRGQQAQGVVSGGMNGLNDVVLTIHTNGYGLDAGSKYELHFTGHVGDDGYVHNGVVTGGAGTGHWDLTERPLMCVIAPEPAPAPAQQPAPPPAAPAARLGVAVNGPTTLPTGQSGIYTVNLSNSGDLGAPAELYISFGGQLLQAGQVTASGGYNCDVINNAGGTTAVRCAVPQFQSKATANIVVQGRGQAPGAGHLTVTMNSSDAGAQFVQKSQKLNVSIT
jgi:hypothetical protein